MAIRRLVQSLPLSIILLVSIVLLSEKGERLGAVAGETFWTSSAVNVVLESHVYMPIVRKAFDFTEPLPPPLAVSEDPPIDFQTARGELLAQGRDLAFNKIGFHIGPNGNLNGIGDWIRQLDGAGVPLFLKSADYAGPIWEAQELMKHSGVPHMLVFRLSTAGQNDGYDYDVPDYKKLPGLAAAEHWARHLAKFPPELEREYVWFETMNEIARAFYYDSESQLNASGLYFDGSLRTKYQRGDGKWVLTNADWLGRFALETAKLALGNPQDPGDDYRWAAFGWSAGEPEPEDWAAPEMQAFLRFAAAHSDNIAVALHEYSFDRHDIGNGYPFLVGRFQALFQVCDDFGLVRPSVLITEWGWEYDNAAIGDAAIADIAWAAWLYAAYPEVKGAAIWYLGGGYANIHNQVQSLIAPLGNYAITNYFGYVPGRAPLDPSLFGPPPGRQPDPDEEPIPAGITPISRREWLLLR